ncbi:MAG TPA: hypothetical protein VK633_07315, partial [Verrucomicrobiae bacterium]|nr:hypothetical protein [Verrucomicrobiae bacterium]
RTARIRLERSSFPQFYGQVTVDFAFIATVGRGLIHLPSRKSFGLIGRRSKMARTRSDEEIRQGVRYAVWPVLAVHLSV